MPKLLLFVEKSSPILRETIEEVIDFNDPTLHEIIKDMRYSILPPQLKAANAIHTSAAGMAANQWGVKKRIFIFAPHGSDADEKLEVMINPSYLPYLGLNEKQPKLVAAYEGCFSIPLTAGLVSRYETIMAIYRDINGNLVERLMKGREARVFQHETDHLNGKLFDGKWDNFQGPDCLERLIFQDAEEMERFWMGEVKSSREQE